MRNHYGKEQYLLIGKLLVSRNPEQAKQLLEKHFSVKPTERNYDTISTYFKIFCLLKEIDPEKYSRQPNKFIKSDNNRLFIGAMLHLYDPKVYNQPKDTIVLGYGFLLKVAKTISIDSGNASKMVREVITREKVYENFREEVRELVILIKQFKKMQNGKNQDEEHLGVEARSAEY